MVVVLRLSALLLVLTAWHSVGRRRLAGPNAILSVTSPGLVPPATDAGEWLQERVLATALVRTHVDMGESAAAVAVTTVAPTRAPHRAFPGPRSMAVGVLISLLPVVAAGAAVYDLYRTGDSGAQATGSGKVGP